MAAAAAAPTEYKPFSPIRATVVARVFAGLVANFALALVSGASLPASHAKLRLLLKQADEKRDAKEASGRLVAHKYLSSQRTLHKQPASQPTADRPGASTAGWLVVGAIRQAGRQLVNRIRLSGTPYTRPRQL